MKVLDLFSGIGGFSIGLEKAGFETVAFCEIEPYCRGVLERHWPDTPIYGDVKQLTGEQLRADGIIPDVIVGGYPCQPFSVAGRQRGEKDPRHLWPEVHRLIRELRPRWVICENVSGHIKLGLDEVLATLEAEEYTVWPFIIPACSVDAPHKRDRVWIVAHSDSGANGRTSRQDEGEDGQVSKRNNGGVVDQPSEVRAADVAHSASDRDSRNTREFSQPYEQTQEERPKERVRQPVSAGEIRPTDVADSPNERIQDSAEEQVLRFENLSRELGRSGEDIGGRWPPEPNVGRVANGVPARSHRIKALGNAVVPQIPEIIGRTIMQFEGNGGL